MSLIDLNLKRIYRTKEDNIVDSFLGPALKESKTYDRGSGYFTLSSLAAVADGLIPFILHHGKIRIVTSVQLSEDDIAIIKKGENLTRENVISKIREEIDKDINGEESIKLDFITNLIAAEILNIRIAYMPDGIYHEKIGILSDDEGNMVYFSGSNNATFSGIHKNWESIMVLTSWWGDTETICDQREYFEKLWTNNIEGLETMPFPEAEKRQLIKKYRVSPDVSSAIKKMQTECPKKKKAKEPYDYQKEAIKQFLDNDGCHFYEMATGTGKTFTAVRASLALYKKVKKLSIIVVVPQIDLQAQWNKAFLEENVKASYLGGYASGNETKYNFGSFIIKACSEDGLNVTISTYDTFFSKIIQQCKPIGSTGLLIIDEAHNLSPNQINLLPEFFHYRLGLSATPERYSKKETEQIVKYFTKNQVETYKYTIEEAIDKGFLSHYMYFPIFSHLTDEEFESYRSYTKQVIVAANQDPKDDEKIKDLLMKRSNVVKKSSNKLEKLRDIVLDKTDRHYSFYNSVVYCGQGKDYESDISIIDSVTEILVRDGGYKVSQFTSNTQDRARVLQEFEDGNYDVLIAIKCFDEGVDVPKLDKIYIMASDALNRQTIQRRGRVLRTCTETGKKMAYIYDFVALPPLEDCDGVGTKNLVINEMRRAKEYSRLADNMDDISTELKDIMSMFSVTEEDLEHEDFEES